MYATLDLPLTFQRGGNFPLDKKSVFATFAELSDYAANSSQAYPGQLCSCLSPFEVYLITAGGELVLLSSETELV